MTKLNPGVDNWMRGQSGLAMGLFLVSFIVQCAIMCFRDVARKTPTNYLLLGFYTICQAFFFSWVTSQYTAASSLMAGGMTAGMTVALTVYAYNTKTDFTMCSSLFFILSVGMMMLCLVSVFMTFVAWWHPVMAAICVVFYALYLIYDTQLIAGGRSHKISLDDYVIGALLLYVDIMMLFLELLRLLGSRK